MPTLESFFFWFLKPLRHSIFRSPITEKIFTSKVHLAWFDEDIVPGFGLRTFSKNHLPRDRWGTSASVLIGSFPRVSPILPCMDTFTVSYSLKWVPQSGYTRCELCWLPFLISLLSVMSGMMALQIPRGLWTAAVMVILVVLSTPVAEGRDSPRKCRAAAPQSHHSGEQALRDPWAGVWGILWSQNTVFYHSFLLFGKES